MNYQIVPAEKEDLENILDLQKASYRSEAALHNTFDIPPLTQTLDGLHEEFENGWLFLKILHNEALIGTGRGITITDTTHIAKLAVNSDFQNKKIGQNLLKELEKRLNNCKRYELFTGDKSERNLYLYKKLGYQEFKRQFINENLTLVYLQRANE